MQREFSFASEQSSGGQNPQESPETSVTINARSRHGLLRKIKSVQIDLNLLSTMFHMRQDNAARALVSPLLSRPSMTTAVSRMYAGGVAYKLEDRVQEAGAESMALQRSA
eukprot:765951-Hanusia_phi.AAC.1